MSNIYKKLEISVAHQELFTDLTEQDSESINGGAESFTIENDSNYNIGYSVDGTSDKIQSNYYHDWTAYSGGIVLFDKDGRSGYQRSRKYNLSSGRTYAFKPNTSTSNPYDVDLYDIT
jgi:hypothetical protein